MITKGSFRSKKGNYMDTRNLEKANNLNKEIKELENFLYTAEKVWTGKINLFSIIANAYGCFNSKEYYMNTKIKKRVLPILQQHLEDLKTELNNI
jgi:hypothetical protein